MNREEYFHTNLTRLNARRTRYLLPDDVITSFNTGDIVPLKWEPIYPGDSVQRHVNFMLRLFTPIAPFMTRCYLDLYDFFVPNRIVWTHWVNFQGENDSGAWTQTYTYVVPQATITAGSITPGTLGDYLDLPPMETTGATYTVSDLPLRAYLHVYNDWFRDENIIAPKLFSKGDVPSSTVTLASQPLKAAKFHDYFTSLLPEPLKGTPVEMLGYAPVVVGAEHVDNLAQPDPDDPTSWHPDAAYGLRWTQLNGRHIEEANGTDLGINPNSWTTSRDRASIHTGTSSYAVPSNLQAQMSITIETIRNAAVVQHVFEKLALSGSRYVESLRSLWGVTPSDASLQIPEYLGGKRFQLNVSDIVSTADTVNGAVGEFLGQVGAYSKNKDGSFLSSKAFTEHGILLTLGVVRVEQCYFQGLRKKWTRKEYFDFYQPALNGIGNQPVMLSEINLDGALANGDRVLGYTEAWSDLRFMPYRLNGVFNPARTGSLSYYTAADVISPSVSLNASFIEQGASGVDRVIAVPSASRGAMQWFGNIHFEDIWTRELDAHSIPGVTRI